MKEKNNLRNKNFTASEMLVFFIIALVIGYFIGIILSDDKETINRSYSDIYLDEFVSNYKYVIDNYYDKVDNKKLIDGAIDGMISSLNDPYSQYFNKEELENFSLMLDGNYRGLGVEIIKENDYMLVTYVFKNSKAQISGIKTGDKILNVDGHSVKDMEASEFSSYIRNNDNDSFRLSIKRNETELEINIDRGNVEIESVTSKIITKENKKIGYIYIGIFASNSYTQFKTELDKLEKDGIDSLIIDVRGNTGGHLMAVENILNLFLDSKHIIYQFEQNNKITPIYGKGENNKKYKIVLLGDSLSASASEVLISSLRDNLGSKLVGDKTYGKGTVQEMVGLSDGTKYKITTKKWLTPKGSWINDTKGIEPDVSVVLDEKFYESLKDEDDTQLQEAIKQAI